MIGQGDHVLVFYGYGLLHVLAKRRVRVSLHRSVLTFYSIPSKGNIQLQYEVMNRVR